MCRLSYLVPVGLITVLATGCGSSLVKTEGVVKLDGVPVEGATVTFSSEDGSKSYSGFTDSTGKFVLQSGEKTGAAPGNYKVTVVKTPKVAGGESMKPGDPEYLKQMAKEAGKDKSKVAPGMAMYQKSSAPKVESELPAVYALSTTTTLTATVPAKDPIVLELKSKP